MGSKRDYTVVDLKRFTAEAYRNHLVIVTEEGMRLRVETTLEKGILLTKEGSSTSDPIMRNRIMVLPKMSNQVELQ